MTSANNAAFRRKAPDGFLPPDWVLERVRVGAQEGPTEAADGFSAKTLGPQWWKERGVDIHFPTKIEDQQVLTRGDLFLHADRVGDDEALLQFLWHVLAWGSGTSRRNNARRFSSCQRPESVALLRNAFESARASQVEEAYSTLIKRGGGMIPWLGPAFFSKFLYFANGHREPSDENARCLILDARVARSLYLAGWSMAPTYRSETRNFSYNWYTETYVSYCQVLEGWTAEVGSSTADMFERALFQGPEPVTDGAKPS